MWRNTETIAWTKRDGYSRPPQGVPGWMMGGAALAMGAVGSGLMMTDTLCPEHRAWVIGCAMIGLTAVVASVVGLLRGASWAPVGTLLAALSGVSIGLVDMTHDTTRGATISLFFGAIAVIMSIVALWPLRALLWAHRAADEMKLELLASETPTAPPAPAEPGLTAVESVASTPDRANRT